MMPDGATLATDPTDTLAQITGRKPPSSYGGFSSAMSDVERNKERDTGAITKATTDSATKDKATADAAYEKLSASTPENIPAPKPPVSDPWAAWASPAMLFGLIAAGFTKTPMIAASKAAEAAVKGKQAGDQQAYQQAMDAWKENTELAYKRHQLMRDDYTAAAEKMKNDLEAGHAAYLAAAAKYDDQIGLLKAQAGLLHDMDQIGLERQRLAISMQEHRDALLNNPTTILTRDALTKADAAISAQEAALGRKLTPAEAATVRDPIVAGIFSEKKPVAPPSKSALSPAAIDRAAEIYHRTRQLPPGFGGQADRDAVMNRESELYPGDAKEAATSLVEAGATAHAGQTSLNQLQKLSDAGQAFEESAKKELDLAVKLIPPTPEPLDSQFLTRWVRSGETQFGDATVPRYQAALISALDEYAKVISGSVGAAGSTDAARAQALSIIPPGATSDQVPGIVDVLKQGMAFKVQSYQDQIAQVTRRLSGAPATEAGPEPAAAAPAAPAIPQVPSALTGRQLQWNPRLRQWRDKATGDIYDAAGVAVR
jgi:hypothetical protein